METKLEEAKVMDVALDVVNQVIYNDFVLKAKLEAKMVGKVKLLINKVIPEAEVISKIKKALAEAKFVEKASFRMMGGNTKEVIITALEIT